MMKKLFRLPVVGALIVFAISLSLGLLYVEEQHRQQITEQKYNAFNRLSALRASLEGLVNSHLVVLRGLKAEVAINPQVAQDRFADIARELIGDDLFIQNIALAPDLIISNVYPYEANKSVLGLNYREVPAQLAAIQKSILLDEIIVAGPVELVQGGRGLIARIPVYSGGSDRSLWGIIAAVIEYDTLMSAAGAYDSQWAQGLWIRGHDAEGEKGAPFFGKASAEQIAQSVTAQVSLPYGSWQIGFVPEGGWRVQHNSLLPICAFAFVFAFMAALATYLIMAVYREKGEAVQTATFRANFDGLTGLMNRHRFTRELETLIKLAETSQQRFSLLFIDLDNFKPVNDTYGHHIGDLLLQEFAARILENIRANDIAARLAGDEFIVIIDQSDSSDEIEMLAERLLRALAEHYCLESHRISISASIGVSAFPTDGNSASELLKSADRAMYNAKASGRNQVFFFNHQMQLEVERHLRLHEEILQGLLRHQFEVYYQPILELNNHRVQKCEALVRWNHPERGLVPPDQFIPVAEQMGSIRELGDFVLRQTCRDIRSFRDHGLTITVSVNRSVNEFHIADPDRRWLRIMAEEGVSGDAIVFEITESLLMESNPRQLKMIENLRQQGVLFSIDDFGTGYSALNYLRSYPVEYLKIDRSFIQDILEDSQDRTLVDVIIRMGQALGIKVIAEGVESVEQLQMLGEFQCDYMQGFLLSKPVPRDEFIQQLLSQSWLKALK